jgi:hypothetical protein
MQITKDTDFVLVQIPEKDLESMVRFIAHSIVQNQNRVVDLAHEIVSGDLTNQDNLVKQLETTLEMTNYQIVLSGAEALALCDELAETIYAEIPGPVMKKEEGKKKDPHLKLVTICVQCHKAKIKGTTCDDCEVK